MRYLLAFLVLMAPMAQAADRPEPCPDFYRYVDFGLRDTGGTLHRGGPVFRAEDFAEVPLLRTDQTACVAVAEVSKDGRGNPIPVVTRIAYLPDQSGLPELIVAAAPDTAALAADPARAHLDRLAQAGTVTARGESFLCAASGETRQTSCQIASPYANQVPVVAICDATLCRLPVLALDERLYASASWPAPTTADLPGLGQALSQKVGKIEAFLTPFSSGL